VGKKIKDFRKPSPGFAALNRFPALSLFRGINSLFLENRFPVVVESIPCSAAQGISSRSSSK
jgi:hypothetical protein